MAIRNSTEKVTGTPTTVTPSSGAATMNCALNNNFIITLSQNTVITASNLKSGDFITLQVLTSGTTSYALVFDSPFKGKGVFRTNRQGSNYSALTYYSDGTRLIETSRTGGIETPANDPRCILALESDWYSLSNGATISTVWRDYSQYAYSLTPNGSILFQTTGTGGKPAVRINGADNQGGNYYTLPVYNLAGAHFYIVWKLNAFNTGGNTWGTSAFTESYHYGDNNIYPNFASSTRRTYVASTVNPSATTWHTYNGYSMSNAWRVFKNNNAFAAEETSNTVAWPDGTTIVPKLGSQGSHSMNVDIVGMYMFDWRRSPLEDSYMKDYITFNYGVTF